MIEEFQGPNRFLSNFFPSKLLPPTLEHHFQASKTDHLLWKNKILSAKSAGQAKRFGRTAPLRHDWDLVKDGIMLILVRKKFRQPDLRELLMGTGTTTLIEGNDWHDNYWGVCAKDCWKESCRNEPGLNKLGHILMQVREEIRKADQR